MTHSKSRVLTYYLRHFDELPVERQLHFATRLTSAHKLGLIQLPNPALTTLTQYLANHPPHPDLAKTLQSPLDYSTLIAPHLRRPYLAKYPQIYGLNRALFRLLRLQNELHLDIRAELFQHISKRELSQLAQALLADETAIAHLSTYAVNAICMLHNLFPELIPTNSYSIIFAKAQHYQQNHPDYPDTLYLYLITHLILCNSNFYQKPVDVERFPEYRQALNIGANRLRCSHSISLDAQLEFLVCCRLANFPTALRPRIRSLCDTSAGFVKDSAAPAELNTPARSEHRSALYLMADLENLAKPPDVQG